MHFWSEEELDWLRIHYKQYTMKEMLPMFNEYFNVDISIGQLKGALKRYNIKSGRTGRFEKRQAAWNKGMKGINFGGEKGKKTQFKKGQKPLNYRPVGSERIDSKDGYILIKVQDEGRYQDRWKLKHRVIWEEFHGRKVPDNHTIVFADGDKYNLDPNNLVLVSRAQLAQLNLRGFLGGNPELLKVGLKLIEIDKKIDDVEVKGGDLEEFERFEQMAVDRGLSRQTFRSRLRKGWPIELAATAALHTVYKKGNRRAEYGKKTS